MATQTRAFQSKWTTLRHRRASKILLPDANKLVLRSPSKFTASLSYNSKHLDGL